MAKACFTNEKLLEITTEVPADNVVSKSFRFFNSATGMLTVLSVGVDGNHWELVQDPDSDVMVSKAHPTSGGGVEYIRFTTTSRTDDRMDVTMDYSRDSKS